MDKRIVNISSYKGRSGVRAASDVQAMVKIYNLISTLQDEEVRERLEMAWYKEAVLIFSLKS